MLALDFFKGHWELERKIFDSYRGVESIARGLSSFQVKAKNELLYCEKGVWFLEGQSYHFQQEFIYRFDVNGFCNVFFFNGDPFYRFSLTEFSYEHLCVDDEYFGSFEIIDVSVFHKKWQVKGPKKEYQLFSKYRRV